MSNIFRSLIRTSAFLRKEIYEVLRQPRLILTLVLGPFLILLVFGVGYNSQARALRTLFVAQPDSPISQEIAKYATSLGPQLVFMGVTGDEKAALDRLRRGEVDIVAVAPDNAYDLIRNNQQATFILYNRELDPYQRDYVNYAGQVYIDEVNRRVLRTVAAQGQRDTSTLQQDIQAARDNAKAMRTALQAGDQAAAKQNLAQMNQNIDNISLAAGASLGLLGGVQDTLGTDNNGQASELLKALNDVRQNSQQLGSSNSLPNTGSNSNSLKNLDKIESDLVLLQNNLTEFESISPDILVSPFNSKAKNINPVQPTPSDYFAPAVLALLMQHLAITFAALSIVRERLEGTMELFRVSPLSALEALLGKFVSYLVFGGFIAAALALLMVYGLRVPMLGNWWNMALIIAALLFTSLGIGFIISILSQTDSQAVQYSMIILLASVFFSGFLMPLQSLIREVRVLSWMLPSTYGNILLRENMLNGNLPNPVFLGGLTAIGIGLFILAWLLLHRLISVASR